MNLLLGDCLEKLKELPDNSVDAVLTDPPYGLSFMGKKWDYDVPKVEVWKEVIRVLKPGGHALIACGTRTQHRMAVNIEDAGFEIRDVITWLYGSGFPKSLDVSKAIDKASGIEREIIGYNGNERPNRVGKAQETFGKQTIGGTITAPSTDAAKQWAGWGTALKPACEFWTLARKPLSEKTVAANVLKWGTGGLNIDGCRVGTEVIAQHQRDLSQAHGNNWAAGTKQPVLGKTNYTTGRFPANLILDEQAALALDDQSGLSKKTGEQIGAAPRKNIGFKLSESSADRSDKIVNYQNDGTLGASRFFYCAKASKSERNAGLEGMPDQVLARSNGAKSGNNNDNPDYNEGAKSGYDKRIVMKNHHPTVKPIRLMEYLCRLITPPNGTVLDPFMGSGSTGVAATNLNYDFVGIERDPEYYVIAKTRISK